MKSPLTRYGLGRLLLRAQQFQKAGFTLLELLVTLLIGSIIIVGLLQLVIEMLQLERRETAVDNTQRDIQRALDYISSDVREAVYVYNDPVNVDAVTQLDDLPGAPSTTVLAFWRPDPIDDSQIPDCSTAFTTGSAQAEECEVLDVRKATYTLVVYQLLTNDATTAWEGKARIVRYELPKYQTLSTLAQKPGYQEPIDATAGINFSNWTPTAANTVGNAAVLVDFVDDPTGPVANTSLLACPVGMDRSPNDSVVASTSWTSFFACVRDSNLGGAATNQDLEIFLRGNFEPHDGGGSIRALSESSGLPTLRAGILVRGVIDKDPD